MILAAVFLFAGWLHLQPSFQPALAWFKNAESRLNHHLAGLFGASSLAWTGHLVHVAIPASRGQHVGWDNFLTVLPHPAGLTPFFTGNWAVYAENPDTATHAFSTSEGSGTAILTFFRWFPPTNTKFMVNRYGSSSFSYCCNLYFSGTYVPYNFWYWS
jgi:photosystem I P700 chlorophyll a apoprotein A2